jgi:hypothetical protein
MYTGKLIKSFLTDFFKLFAQHELGTMRASRDVMKITHIDVENTFPKKKANVN